MIRSSLFGALFLGCAAAMTTAQASGSCSDLHTAQPYDGIFFDVAAVPTGDTISRYLEVLATNGVEKIVLFDLGSKQQKDQIDDLGHRYGDLVVVGKHPWSNVAAPVVFDSTQGQLLWLLDELLNQQPSQKIILLNAQDVDPVRLNRLMQDYKQLWLGLGGPWAQQVGCDAAVRRSKDLVEKYPDRVVFASVAVDEASWQDYEQNLPVLRQVFGSFAEELIERIAFQNAERLYDIPAAPP